MQYTARVLLDDITICILISQKAASFWQGRARSFIHYSQKEQDFKKQECEISFSPDAALPPPHQTKIFQT